MHRYCKGQTWRPPSAADSAAHADAAESHRREPAQPQDLAPVGQDILVKTPATGIPGRDGDTIYWAKCKRCIERYTADEQEIVDTDEEVIVYNLFPEAVPCDQYVTTSLTACGTRYANLPQPMWVVLDDDLYPCDTAGAKRLTLDADDECCEPGDSVTVADPHGVVSDSALAVNGYIPAGSHALVIPDQCDCTPCQWVAIAFGSGECCESSESSESSDESSESSESSSESSESESSESESSESSESESESSESESGSDKSSAIVPASWSKPGYTALFIAECPEVRFDDVMVVKGLATNRQLPIDPKFLEVCQADSVEVCGCVCDLPVLVGAAVKDGSVHLRFAGERPYQTVQVVIRLTGIRKGFRGHRFPDRSRRQFEANERFINSAYSGK